MFFYRDTVIQAKKKEELFDHSECPICHNKLTHDWLMPLRYEPMVLFRMFLIGGVFATLLSLLVVKLEEIGWLTFLDQFYYSTQIKLVAAFLICMCLPAAFFVILGEIKLGHLTQDDMVAYGLRCPTCGNGFVGLVDCSQKQSPIKNCDVVVETPTGCEPNEVIEMLTNN